MDSPAKSKTTEATGISRSGRVRKKSSKLTDFESPDEIDTRFKRRTDRPQKVATPKTLSEDSDSYMDEEIIDVKDEPLEVEEWGVEGEEMEEGEEEEEEEESVGGEDGGEGNLQEFSDSLQVDEDSTDVSRETSSYTQAQSLYFSEKQGKKSIVMKGGQVVQRKKAQRKDKGPVVEISPPGEASQEGGGTLPNPVVPTSTPSPDSVPGLQQARANSAKARNEHRAALLEEIRDQGTSFKEMVSSALASTHVTQDPPALSYWKDVFNPIANDCVAIGERFRSDLLVEIASLIWRWKRLAATGVEAAPPEFMVNMIASVD